MEVLRHSLKKRLLGNKLPGHNSHLKLAPESRVLFDEKESKVDAAVLILLFNNREEKLCTVFMKRTSYDGPHSGQISFPGGKYEDIDNTLFETALRESNEEIGINPSIVHEIGKITNLYIPVSNFLVHPYIAISSQTPTFQIDEKEVEYVIECTIDELINIPIKYTRKFINDKYYNIPYFDVKGEFIWGATAMILSELIDILNEIPDFTQKS